MKRSTFYFPAFLKLEGKNCLVFGGGQIALQKARSLVSCGAKVTAISKVFSPDFKRFARKHGVRIKTQTSIAKNLNGTRLVICATSDSAFNRRVSQFCRKRNIPVNVVDEPRLCSFIFPSVVRRGKLQIAISTGGASPSLAKLLRKKLEQNLKHGFGRLLQRISRRRRRLMAGIPRGKRRTELFKRAAKAAFRHLTGLTTAGI